MNIGAQQTFATLVSFQSKCYGDDDEHDDDPLKSTRQAICTRAVSFPGLMNGWIRNPLCAAL